ncbi:hypothetical protein GCM10025864_29160 [Luteimicrobium album]|uniref:Uncharacterized protein n=1 Tax=Luteimicrobium album TaxID=1054550 RepID=A0ABQ6I4L3_9MICO|nr:hypothetical protein GCM10025864_29160 [Luteimicrobium album]
MVVLHGSWRQVVRGRAGATDRGPAPTRARAAVRAGAADPRRPDPATAAGPCAGRAAGGAGERAGDDGQHGREHAGPPPERADGRRVADDEQHRDRERRGEVRGEHRVVHRRTGEAREEPVPVSAVPDGGPGAGQGCRPRDGRPAVGEVTRVGGERTCGGEGRRRAGGGQDGERRVRDELEREERGDGHGGP